MNLTRKIEDDRNRDCEICNNPGAITYYFDVGVQIPQGKIVTSTANVSKYTLVDHVFLCEKEECYEFFQLLVA